MSTGIDVVFDPGARSPEAVEREVRAAVEDACGERPDTHVHHGVVVWPWAHHDRDLSGPDYHELDVDVPRLVTTTYNDTSDGGSATLYERLDGRFVPVDGYAGPHEMTNSRHQVIDYFRLNYGIVPWFCYGDEEDLHGSPVRGPVDASSDGHDDGNSGGDRDGGTGADSSGGDGDADGLPQWSTIRRGRGDSTPDGAPDPGQLAEWIDAAEGARYTDESPDLPDPGTLEPVLDDDGHYHVAAAVLREVSDAAPEAVDRLDADDPAVRARAVRRLAPIDVDAETYERLLRTVPTVDRRTQALVAPHLWDPAPVERKSVPPASLVSALAALVDSDAVAAPELRAAGLMGAADAVAEFVRATEENHDPPAAVADFYAAYADALSDPDRRVRERAARLLMEYPKSDYGHVFTGPCWSTVEFPTRWRLARAGAAVEADPRTETRGDPGAFAGLAHRGDPEQAPAFVDYAYREVGPGHERIREQLADLAREHPGAVLEAGALDPAVEAVATADRGDQTLGDLQLLAALVRERPDRVAAVAGDLAALLDHDEPGDEFGHDPGERRRAAARALGGLLTARPAAVPDGVDRSTLAEATADVTYRVGSSASLDPDRLPALVDVAPDRATDLLADLPDRVREDRGDDGLSPKRVAEAVDRAAAVDPDAVAGAAPALRKLVADPREVDHELPFGVARAARDRPDAFREYVDPLVDCLAHCDWRVRAGAASALAAIGEGLDDPPESVRALLSADRTLDPGDVSYRDRERVGVEDDPALADRVVAATPDGLGASGYRRLAALLAEVAEGDEDVAVDAFRELLERRWSAVLPRHQPGAGGLPTVLAERRPELVGRAADPLVGALARSDPDGEVSTSDAGDENSTAGTDEGSTSDAGDGATRVPGDDPAADPPGPADRAPTKFERRSIRRSLVAVAETDPATIRAAVERRFGDSETFRERRPDDADPILGALED